MCCSGSGASGEAPSSHTVLSHETTAPVRPAVETAQLHVLSDAEDATLHYAITTGPQPRLGIVGLNEQDDAVLGIVLLTKGKDASEVLQGVNAKIAELNNHLLNSSVSQV